MEKTRITVKENFERVLEVLKTQNENELVEFINTRIELLNRKKSSSRVNEDMENLSTMIIDALQGQENGLQINDMLELENFKNYRTTEDKALSNQKMSACLKKLIDTNQVERIQVKKATYYKLV